MKTLFFLIILLLPSIAFSQGNLQFNQVKLVSTQETVPAGKVWKVESASYSGGSVLLVGCNSYNSCSGGTNTYSPVLYSSMSYKINSVAYFTDIVAANGSISSSSTFPIWLSAGNKLEASSNMGFLSVLEFNIIP
jgi:hypothetical protein